MIRRPPRSTLDRSSAASDVYKRQLLGSEPATELRNDIELVNGVYDPLDLEAYRRGELAPVFFGSAFNNFGVREVLDTFVRIAPPPGPRETDQGKVDPEAKEFSGFIFKIHANLDPNHRDRVAFLRICSGHFKRNTFYQLSLIHISEPTRPY